MKEYFEARRIYRKNMLIGIGVCLFVYVIGTDVIAPLMDVHVNDIYGTWTIAVMLGYFIYSRVRKALKKENAYTGKLRMIPKMFMIYMFLSMMFSLALAEL